MKRTLTTSLVLGTFALATPAFPIAAGFQGGQAAVNASQCASTCTMYIGNRGGPSGSGGPSGTQMAQIAAIQKAWSYWTPPAPTGAR